MKSRSIIILSSVIILFSLFIGSLLKAEDGWEFQKIKEGVEIYLRDVPGSEYREYKGIMDVRDARVTSLVAAFYDTPSYTRWMHNCIESRLLKILNPYERYTYTVIHAPWPAKNRDTISYSLVRQDPNDLTVTIAITGKPDYISPMKNRVRIPYMNALWTFKPLVTGEVRVSYQTVNDAGGWLPLKLLNMSMIDMPFLTMVKLRNIIKESKYTKAVFSVIAEPRWN